jgi:hypothetical protein
MSPICLVLILEEALFRRQPKGWTPNNSLKAGHRTGLGHFPQRQDV